MINPALCRTATVLIGDGVFGRSPRRINRLSVSGWTPPLHEEGRQLEAM